MTLNDLDQQWRVVAHRARMWDGLDAWSWKIPRDEAASLTAGHPFFMTAIKRDDTGHFVLLAKRRERIGAINASRLPDGSAARERRHHNRHR